MPGCTNDDIYICPVPGFLFSVESESTVGSNRVYSIKVTCDPQGLPPDSEHFFPVTLPCETIDCQDIDLSSVSLTGCGSPGIVVVGNDRTCCCTFDKVFICPVDGFTFTPISSVPNATTTTHTILVECDPPSTSSDTFEVELSCDLVECLSIDLSSIDLTPCGSPGTVDYGNSSLCCTTGCVISRWPDGSTVNGCLTVTLGAQWNSPTFKLWHSGENGRWRGGTTTIKNGTYVVDDTDPTPDVILADGQIYGVGVSLNFVDPNFYLTPIVSGMVNGVSASVLGDAGAPFPESDPLVAGPHTVVGPFNWTGPSDINQAAIDLFGDVIIDTSGEEPVVLNEGSQTCGSCRSYNRCLPDPASVFRGDFTEPLNTGKPSNWLVGQGSGGLQSLILHTYDYSAVWGYGRGDSISGGNNVNRGILRQSIQRQWDASIAIEWTLHSQLWDYFMSGGFNATEQSYVSFLNKDIRTWLYRSDVGGFGLSSAIADLNPAMQALNTATDASGSPRLPAGDHVFKMDFRIDLAESTPLAQWYDLDRYVDGNLIYTERFEINVPCDASNLTILGDILSGEPGGAVTPFPDPLFVYPGSDPDPMSMGVRNVSVTMTAPRVIRDVCDADLLEGAYTQVNPGLAFGAFRDWIFEVGNSYTIDPGFTNAVFPIYPFTTSDIRQLPPGLSLSPSGVISGTVTGGSGTVGSWDTNTVDSVRRCKSIVTNFGGSGVVSWAVL